MQNKQINILSTKQLSTAHIQQALDSNFHISCIPFIETNVIDDEVAINKIKELELRKLTAVFTSSKSVDAVSQMLSSEPDWEIYCLFGATREKVKQKFPNAIIHAEAKDSASLADELLAAKIVEAYFFCGDKRMDTIPQKLLSKNIMLHQHTVYTTHLTPHKVGSNFDSILFFSPSAVESFFSVNKIIVSTKYFAVGNTTAAALSSKTNNIFIAKQASGEAMLEKLKEVYLL